jgi:hypothetical protein
LVVLLFSCNAVLASETPSGTQRPDKNEQPEYLQRLNQSRNAGIAYLTAALWLPGEEDARFRAFFDGPLLAAPPCILADYPEAAEAIARCRTAIEAMEHGAKWARCTFSPDFDLNSQISTMQQAPIARLARRACGYGRFLEHHGKAEEAATLYLNVLRLSHHCAQDRYMWHIYMGMDLQRLAFDSVVRLIARDLTEPVARQIVDQLKVVPAQPFDVAGMFEVERKFAQPKVWDAIRVEFTESKDLPATIEQWLKFADVGGDQAGVIWAAAGLPTSERELLKLIDQAARDYDTLMRRVVQASRLPFEQSRAQLASIERDISRRRREYENSPIRSLQRRPFGWLEPIITPVDFVSIRSSAARAETELAVLKVLATAALIRAERGKWPEALKDIALRLPAQALRDPLGNAALSYRLDSGLPTVSSVGIPEEAGNADTGGYVFSLSQVKAREGDALEEWRRSRRKEEQRDGDASHMPPAEAGSKATE